MVTVFLVDGREDSRRRLAELLGADPDLHVVGQAGTAAEALAGISAAGPDVVVLDIALPDGSGADLCRDLLNSHAGPRCLILTACTDEQSMLDAVLAGVSGYVVEDDPAADPAAAVKTVASGDSVLDNRAAAVLMSRLRKDDQQDRRLRELTATELSLLRMLGEGLTNREIAQRLFLAEKTVKNYVSRLLSKLDLPGRRQAALYAATAMDGDQPGFR